jgi:hypothetical protein
MAADAVETIVVPGDPDTACAVLAARSGLSKIRVKDAMQKGAAWLTSKRGKRRRIRRATTAVVPGDRLALYYDAAILAAKPPRARMVADRRDYSVWFKPAGLMTQGTDFGDHCCLLRQVDVFFRSRRPVFPVHRLDREAAGILLLAHSKSAAAKLSRLFRNRSIAKHYRAEVLGPIPAGRRQRIEVRHLLRGRLDHHRPAAPDPPPFRHDRPPGHRRPALRHRQQKHRRPAAGGGGAGLRLPVQRENGQVHPAAGGGGVLTIFPAAAVSARRLILHQRCNILTSKASR